MLKKSVFMLALLVAALTLHAQARITDFAVNAQVLTDGSVAVEETISVIAQHKKIKRGIYRELPTPVGQRISDITLFMDGAPHPYFTQKQLSNTRINFGNDDYISTGGHTYRLHYVMSNAVRLFKDHDEFYWNVTGSDWAFPIEQAAIRVELPDGAEPDYSRISSYVGNAGTKGHPAYSNGLFFQTGRISPGQDFTIAIPWQKGIITPSSAYYLRYWIIGLFILGALALGIYYKWAWNSVGQDPTTRIITQYAPPENISPAQMKYIYDMGMNSNLLPVTIVSLAMKGALAITEEKHFFTKNVYITRLYGQDHQPLSEEESLVLRQLFSTAGKIKLNDRSNASLFKTIQQHLHQSLQAKTAPYFRTNTLYNLPTWIYLVMGSMALFRGDTLKVSLIILFGVYLFCGLLASGRFFQKLSNFLFTLLGVGVIVIIYFAVFEQIISQNFMATAGVIILCIVAALGGMFSEWIKAYTIDGREIMDQIEGFKRYMKIGEAGRVAASDPTDQLRIFCDYLPYAYAFGLASQWMKQFTGKFTDEQLRGVMTSRGFTGIGPGNMVSSINSSLSSLTSAVSSGSGGRGGAGGGSGGGGGGGR